MLHLQDLKTKTMQFWWARIVAAVVRWPFCISEGGKQPGNDARMSGVLVSSLACESHRSELSRREGQPHVIAEWKIVLVDFVGRFLHPNVHLIFLNTVSGPRDGSTLMLIPTRMWAPSASTNPGRRSHTQRSLYILHLRLSRPCSSQ